MKTAILYYTDGRLPKALANEVLRRIEVESTINQIPVIKINQLARTSRTYAQMLVNILCGIGQTDADFIYLAEHDVLYPPEYFKPIQAGNDWDFQYMRGGFYLSEHGFSPRKGFPLSNLCGRREALLKHFNELLAMYYNGERIVQAEPKMTDFKINLRKLNPEYPFVDIRHGDNYTGERNSKVYFPEVQCWGSATKLWKVLKGEN